MNVHPRQDFTWVTVRAAFGHQSAARALILQVSARGDDPSSSSFRLLSNLTAFGTWSCEATFARSDQAFGAYLRRQHDARLFDYFVRPPRQTPPRWLIPQPIGLSLRPPEELEGAAGAAEQPAAPRGSGPGLAGGDDARRHHRRKRAASAGSICLERPASPGSSSPTGCARVAELDRYRAGQRVPLRARLSSAMHRMFYSVLRS